jgi:hypothetical protein
MRGFLGRQMRVRTAVWATGLLTLMSVTLVAGRERELIELPRVQRELTLAIDDASELLSCMQGVQDEIYLPGAASLETGPALGAARRRLSSCRVEPIRRRLDGIDLPPSAPIGRVELREARDALAETSDSLHRLVTEADGTIAAMDTELRARDSLEDVVLGYRAGEAQYELASQSLGVASAILGRAGLL